MELGYERRESRLIIPEDEDEVCNTEPIADEFEDFEDNDKEDLENGPSSDEEEEKDGYR